VVSSQVTAEYPDNLVITIAAGHETTLASDELHCPRLLSGFCRQPIAKMLT